MNISAYNTDRNTHLRIVVTALAASIAIVAFALSVRINSDDLLAARPRSGAQVTAVKAMASSGFRAGSPTRIEIR